MNPITRRLASTGLMLVVFVIGTSASKEVQAQKPGLTTAEGLGEAWPSRPNVGLGSQFKVFRWLQGDIPVFQVNRADGRVLAVFALGASGAVSLGIGEAADKVRSEFGPPISRLSGSQSGSETLSTGASTATGQCPCKSETVFDDGNNVIVVVTDKNGNVIGVYTFTKTKPK